MNWRLLSSNFKAEGVLFINVDPEVIIKELKSETQYYHEIGITIQKEIEDYWEYTS